MKYPLPIATCMVFLGAAGYSEASTTVPYAENQEVLNQETLYFSSPASGLRTIQNISCTIRLVLARNIGIPMLTILDRSSNESQYISFPMTSLGVSNKLYAFVNTTPILAFVKPGDKVVVSFGLPPVDNINNAVCTLTGVTTE